MNFTNAAFLVKRPAVITNPVVTNPSAANEQGAVAVHERHNLLSRIESRLLSIFRQSQQGWEHRGEGSRAIFWATWGLLLWPLGILAIVHGVRGLSSHNGIEQDRATLALILGIGETLLTIGALIWIFTAPVYYYYY